MLTGLFLAIMGVLGAVILTVQSHRWDNSYKASTWGRELLLQNLLLKLQTVLWKSVVIKKETPRKKKRQYESKSGAIY